MAASLLQYANREAVAKALTARGYVVSRATVNRWARGKEMPEIAGRMIAELFGHQTQETAPAWWAEAAEQLVDQIEERIMPATSGLVAPEQAVEIVTRAVERLGLPQQPPAEDPAAESAEPRDAADRAAKRQP